MRTCQAPGAEALTPGRPANQAGPGATAIAPSLKILQRKRVPRFTITADGLPGDPVNLVLTGTLQQLDAAFKRAGWSPADRLGVASSLRILRTKMDVLALGNHLVRRAG